MEAAAAIAEGKLEAAGEILTRVAKVSNPKPNSEQRLMGMMTTALKSRVNPAENPAPVTELFSERRDDMDHHGRIAYWFAILVGRPRVTTGCQRGRIMAIGQDSSPACTQCKRPTVRIAEPLPLGVTLGAAGAVGLTVEAATPKRRASIRSRASADQCGCPKPTHSPSICNANAAASNHINLRTLSKPVTVF